MVQDVDDKLYDRADEHIHQSNCQITSISSGKVSASMMYSLARFFAISVLVPLLLGGCGSTCENIPSQTIASPSGAFQAVVFSRNCGATTGFNTQVSVLRANEALPDEGGNTFVSNVPVPITVRWSGTSALHISEIGDTSPIKQNQHVLEVVVSYAK